MNRIIFIFSLISLLLVQGCNDYLDAKPDEALVIPQQLTDLRAILDNDRYLNGAVQFDGLTPSLGEIGTTDYFANNESVVDGFPAFYQQAYVWGNSLPNMDRVVDWNKPYEGIFYANVVLDNLRNRDTPAAEQQQGLQLRAEALFHRAHLFHQLAQVFAPPFGPDAGSLSGIPLRLTADVNEKISRADLNITYLQIIADLQTAVAHLPVTPLYFTRPNKPAAYALLSRVYLSMRDYTVAGRYADSCLALKSELMDYNDYHNSTATYPFSRMNKEVLFHCVMVNKRTTPISSGLASVDSNLYKAYSTYDLRKTCFFRPHSSRAGHFLFRGTYDGSFEYFSGLATDEVWLTRAECRARLGDESGALADLNQLLAHRMDKDHFSPLTAGSSHELLTVILKERRKELLMRGIRWMDLRRLNTEAAWASTLNRSFKGVNYTLPPNDPRYTYPIPDNVIGYHPDMEQNLRE